MRPNVRIALDCWDGDAAAAVYTPAQLQEARTDADVIRVYPRMKDFEQVRAVHCTPAGRFLAKCTLGEHK
jgi:hypothetical protein